VIASPGFAGARSTPEGSAEVIASPGFAGARSTPEGSVEVIELGGPRDLSPNDLAAMLARRTGKPVRAVEAPLDAVVPTFTGFGLSRPFAELFREMYAGIASGRVAWEGGAARAVRGTVTPDEVLS
jgi:uncharacterized protein YbjT (DUF2867 family)